jgi:hypothetical protein
LSNEYSKHCVVKIAIVRYNDDIMIREQIPTEKKKQLSVELQTILNQRKILYNAIKKCQKDSTSLSQNKIIPQALHTISVNLSTLTSQHKQKIIQELLNVITLFSDNLRHTYTNTTLLKDLYVYIDILEEHAADIFHLKDSTKNQPTGYIQSEYAKGTGETITANHFFDSITLPRNGLNYYVHNYVLSELESKGIVIAKREAEKHKKFIDYYTSKKRGEKNEHLISHIYSTKEFEKIAPQNLLAMIQVPHGSPIDSKKIDIIGVLNTGGLTQSLEYDFLEILKNVVYRFYRLYDFEGYKPIGYAKNLIAHSKLYKLKHSNIPTKKLNDLFEKLDTLITEFHDFFVSDIENITDNYDVNIFLECDDVFDPASNKYILDTAQLKQNTLSQKKQATAGNQFTELLSKKTLTIFSKVVDTQEKLISEIDSLMDTHFKSIEFKGIQVKSSPSGLANHLEKSSIGVVYIPKNITNQFMKQKITLTLDHKKILKTIGDDVENLLTNS